MSTSQASKSVTLRKSERPAASQVTPSGGEGKYPQHRLRGTVKIHGDLLEPVLPVDSWEGEGE